MTGRLVIAIDGPVGAGKTSAARRLARRLGYRYIDSGAMYRAVAWKALHLGLHLRDRAAVAAVADRIRIRFVPRGRSLRIHVDGSDVTRHLRTRAVDEGSSVVSTHPRVRRRMVELQRAMGRRGGVVMDGRDIGTVVFPKADLKFFLGASLAERARRRHRELAAAGTAPANVRAVLAAVRRRDARDRRRRASPLRPASDAIVIDSTRLSLRGVVDRMWRAVVARGLSPQTPKS